MNLSAKVALIAGGARMGVAIGTALGSKGCTVLYTYRKSGQAAAAAVSHLKALGIKASALPSDVSDGPAVHELVKRVGEDFGRLDVLVNLASVYAPSDLASDVEFRDWDSNMMANAKAAYMLTSAAAPAMRRTGGGRIIHFSDWTSASGRPRYADYVPYFVSKLAVQGVVEGLALAFAPEVLINAIAPGPILPPPQMSSAEIKAVEDATPLRRWGGAEEIARTVVFLAETDFVTGETIRVDGGRHLQ